MAQNDSNLKTCCKRNITRISGNESKFSLGDPRNPAAAVTPLPQEVGKLFPILFIPLKSGKRQVGLVRARTSSATFFLFQI